MGHHSSDHDERTVIDAQYVRASDIGTFLYCQRAWWLTRIVGLEPDARLRRQRGTQAHQQHAWWVWLMQLLRLAGISGGILALIMAIGLWYGWW